MSFDVLTLTPPNGARTRDRIIFPYPAGRTFEDYESTGAYLTINNGELTFRQSDEVFSLSYKTDGIHLHWNAGPLVPAGKAWTLRAPLSRETEVVSSGGVLGAASRPATLAGLGDSITALGISNNVPGVRGYTSRNFLSWASALSRQRVYHSVDLNFGVSGETSAQILARVGQVIAAAPGYCTVLAGTNDIGVYTAAQTIANLAAIYDALAAAGIVIIALPILTRQAGATNAQLGTLAQVNQWILSQRFIRRNFYVADARLVYCDLTTGYPKNGITSDLLHPNPYGAFLIGREVANVLTAILPAAVVPFYDPLDVYANNPANGNLLANGHMSGTAGTLVGGLTGTLASNWSVSADNRPTGGTLAFSKGTWTDGRAYQQLDFGGTYSTNPANYMDIIHTIPIGNLAAGDVLEAMMDLEVVANAANVLLPCSLLQVTAGSGNVYGQDWDSSTAQVAPPEAFTALLRSQRITVPAGATTAQMTVRIRFKDASGSTTAAATMRFGSVSVRKVN